MKSSKPEVLSLMRDALAKRGDLIDREATLRLFDGSADGIQNLFVDKLSSCALLHVLADSDAASRHSVQKDTLDVPSRFEELKSSADFLLSELKLKAVYLRIHERRARDSAEQQAQLLSGEATPEVQVNEHGMLYVLRPETAVNAGVFVDTREVRKVLCSSCSGQSVLNLFCYTGLLGLSAWQAGAAAVTQVDISKAMLRWAAENKALNEAAHFSGASAPGSPKREMRFICEDALSFLEKEGRRVERGKERYDTVIIDPPSFGAGAKRSFSIERKLPILLSGGMKVLEPGGRLFAMCNLRAFSAVDIKSMAEQAAASLGRRVQKWQMLAAPAPDFRTPPTQASSMRGVLAYVA